MTIKRKCRAGTVKWLRGLYAELNAEFFGGNLPRNLPIEWADLPGTIIARVRWNGPSGGPYGPYVMQFDTCLKHRKLQKQCGMSMLHEMVHLTLGPEVACEEWDGEFDKQMFALAERGAFRLFW